MKLLVSAGLAAILATSVSQAALAQADLSSNFKRDKNVTVRQRPRPDYEAIGVKAGGFTVYPRVTLEAERNEGKSPEEAIKLGWAHGALLTTFPGDVTMARLDEVEAFAKGGSARVQR